MNTAVTICPLTTRAGLHIGTVEVESTVDGRVEGTFTPGPDYLQVEPHFRHFEELVDGQILSLTDQAMAVIDGLGIVAHLPGGEFPVHEVQIYSDGGFSCRLPTTVVNGKHAG